MCLVSKNKLSISVTKKDLTVYKVLEKRGAKYFSPFYYVDWRVGKVNEINIRFICEDITYFEREFEVNKGFHAYTDKDSAVKLAMEKESPYIKLVICEMMIPAESLIIKGNKHEIVTNKMKFIKIL